jgi:hypothetical protein
MRATLNPDIRACQNGKDQISTIYALDATFVEIRVRIQSNTLPDSRFQVLDVLEQLVVF